MVVRDRLKEHRLAVKTYSVCVCLVLLLSSWLTRAYAEEKFDPSVDVINSRCNKFFALFDDLEDGKDDGSAIRKFLHTTIDGWAETTRDTLRLISKQPSHAWGLLVDNRVVLGSIRSNVAPGSWKSQIYCFYNDGRPALLSESFSVPKTESQPPVRSRQVYFDDNGKSLFVIEIGPDGLPTNGTPAKNRTYVPQYKNVKELPFYRTLIK